MSSIFQEIIKANNESKQFEFFYNVDAIKNQIKLGLTLKKEFVLVSKKDSSIYRIDKISESEGEVSISISKLPVDTKQTSAFAGNTEEEFIQRFNPDLIIEDSIVFKKPRNLTFWQKLTWGL